MIDIATMGMFRSCCGTRYGGGGAPPYRTNVQEQVKPVVFIRNVEMKTLNSPEDILEKIHVRLKDED